MAAVVVAVRNKQYDAEEAQDILFLDGKNMIHPFPPEAEWKADYIIGKLMMDGSWLALNRFSLPDVLLMYMILAGLGRRGE